ncbi:MAG: inorganic phosphate transporter, partial [Gammaproteobacteria bacterium]|nr:inorganic phosphate transporter [Gammaproteobacteria bacterium]
MDQASIYILLAGALGLFMAWGIGANDVANAMATSIGSKALTIKQAVLIAAIFEFSGAFLAGGQVTSTIRKGIIDSTAVAQSPDLLIYGMLASLTAAGLWLVIASRAGWPVSTTHTIVGAIVGFAMVGIGMDAVMWARVGTIVISWVVSPVMSGILAFILFRSVQKFILNTDNPIANAKKYVPVYIFATGFMIALVTLFKGLKHVGLEFSTAQSYGIAFVVGLVVMACGIFYISRIKIDPLDDKDFHYANVEKIFSVLMVVTACSIAFAHGSNDVANAVGPMAAVISIANEGVVTQNSAMPVWVLLVGGVGIVLGLAMYGKKVIATVGQNITELTPSRGFACGLAASTTVVIASSTGLPISTTHTLVGAVLGVGLARGIGALNLGVVGTIFMSWIITLPAGALLSIFFFYFFKGIFG